MEHAEKRQSNDCERVLGLMIPSRRREFDADDNATKAGDPDAAGMGDLRAAGGRCHPRKRAAWLDAGPANIRIRGTVPLKLPGSRCRASCGIPRPRKFWN